MSDQGQLREVFTTSGHGRKTSASKLKRHLASTTHNTPKVLPRQTSSLTYTATIPDSACRHEWHLLDSILCLADLTEYSYHPNSLNRNDPEMMIATPQENTAIKR